MRRGKDVKFVLNWDEDVIKPNLGDGVSRTKDPSAVLWSVDVAYPKGPGMHTTVLAKTKAEARKFTRNRYPTATEITVHGKATR